MKRRRSKIDGQFAWQLIEMLELPAHRALSLSARRALDRIQIEFASHGGKDNGHLPVTFDDFEQFGIDRHSVAPALRELVALGFVEVTERGRAGNAEFRTPNKFRLTHRDTDKASATNDWRRIKTDAQAFQIASAARRARIRASLQKQKPVRKTPTEASGENPNRKSEIFGVGNPHYSPREKPPLLSISRGGADTTAKGDKQEDTSE